MFQTMTEGVVSISLTGHRPSNLAGYNLKQPYYERLRQRLIRIIERSLNKFPVVECHSGMALGADTIWAQAIVECQQKYGRDRIKFIAEIPSEQQPSRWQEKDQKMWHYLMSKADSFNEYSAANEGKSYPYILNQRNIGMIKACDILIAVYDDKIKKGGTANGVRDGIRMNKFITYIRPDSI